MNTLKGLFTTREAARHGITRQALSEAVSHQKVERICRGVYQTRDAEMSVYFAEQLCALKYPQGVVCLISALRFYQMTTQNPPDVWLAVKNHVRIRHTGYPQIRLTLMSDVAYTYGIEEHTIGGICIRLYSPAKTVADCFKYRTKVGLDVALEALQEGYRAKRFTLSELFKAAAVCRVEKILTPYVEGMLQ